MFHRRKSAQDILIESLREEIHWLRSCIPWAVAQGVPAVAGAPLAAPVGAPLLSSVQALSDDEEDIQQMLDNGDIDTEEASALLAALGFTNTEIELT